MNSAASIARIEASNEWRAKRVERFDLPEGKLPVKGQLVRRSVWPHRMRNVFAWMADLSFLGSDCLGQGCCLHPGGGRRIAPAPPARAHMNPQMENNHA